MGNSKSSLDEWNIDEPILETKHWTLHEAENVADGTLLSVFVAAPDLNCEDNLVALNGRNLKLFRHPGILKFVDFCEGAGKVCYLFTENARPLSVVLERQTPLQVCLGLQSVAQALQFLHQKGRVCHNNVSVASVFVTPDGRWKLGGLEFALKFESVNQAALDKTRHLRYEKAVPLEEKAAAAFRDHSARDIYSFGVLVEEAAAAVAAAHHHHQLRKPSSAGEDPNLADFAEFAVKELQNQDQWRRPSLSQVLDHPYFKDEDYLSIVAFLDDLPVRLPAEKAEFFAGLTERLMRLPELVVASQLANLLLSRMVLLDQTAVGCFLPNLLTPYPEGWRRYYDPNRNLNPLLSLECFRDHLKPCILRVFSVLDLQIRMVLLSFFTSFHQVFNEAELKLQVLPQLLLGIRDSNDQMVASTLRALSEIVPVLGASVVVGKNRHRIFADGSPSSRVLGARHPAADGGDDPVEPPFPKGAPGVGLPQGRCPDDPDEDHNHREMSSRRSPIGAEDLKEEQQHHGHQEKNDGRVDDAAAPSTVWDDWDDAVGDQGTAGLKLDEVADRAAGLGVVVSKAVREAAVKRAQEAAVEEVFAGMEPVITNKPMDLIDALEKNAAAQQPASSKFAVMDTDLGDEDGWDQDQDEWGKV